MRPRRRIAGLILAGLLSAPAWGAPVPEPDDLADAVPPPVSDPFVRFNRWMFEVNDRIYRAALRPASRQYEKSVPRPVRVGLGNFFDNLRFPVRFAGSLLQLKFGRTARETGRFLANTIIGVGGIERVSDELPGLAPEPTEDIGQALGFWGAGPGPYLVLPLLGPSDARDLVGRAGDYALTPTWWRFDHYERWGIHFAVQTVDAAQATPGILRSYDAFRVGAIDPYIGVRDAYLAHRAAEIRR